MNQEHQHHPDADGRKHELRTQLLSQTTKVIRRRRYLRRAEMVAACAGCYLAGLLTVTFMAGEASPELVRDVVVRETVTSEVAVHDESAAEPTVIPEPVLVTEPVMAVEQSSDAELQARLRLQERARLVRMQMPRKKKSRFLSLRDLGDQYLLEQEDPAGAARCYQMALRYSTREEVNQQSDEGTWLFRALKLDHHWETDDARNQG